MIIVSLTVGIVTGFGLGIYFYNRARLASWYRNAARFGQTTRVAGRRYFYRSTGDGPATVVIETALATPSAEWWPLQDEIARFARVFSYDRAGYGWSDTSPSPRTGEKIADELNELLEVIGLRPPYVLVGHSQGGLYMNHYARRFPHNVAAVVLIDPLSPRDNEFKKQLAQEVFKGSGVDKTLGIKSLLPLSRAGLLRLFRPILLKSPPFYYYKNIPTETIEVVWQHLLRPNLGITALDEYQQAHSDVNNALLLGNDEFPDVVLKVICHDQATVIDEIVKYGGLEKSQANEVAVLWESLIREHLNLSKQSQWLNAEHASHFVHLDRPELIIATIREVIALLKTNRA